MELSGDEALEAADDLGLGLAVVGVLDFAERLTRPAVELPAPPGVGPGRDAWAAWCAEADRRQLAQALGILVARLHRARAAVVSHSPKNCETSITSRR
jgi:hypothetical protein